MNGEAVGFVFDTDKVVVKTKAMRTKILAMAVLAVMCVGSIGCASGNKQKKYNQGAYKNRAPVQRNGQAGYYK